MVQNLAYTAFASPEIDAWRSFGADILGAEVVDGPEGAVRLRIDDAAWRIQIEPGPADDLVALGWHAPNDDPVRERLAAAGIEVNDDADLAAARDVESVAWFVDPFGFRHELVGGLRVAGPFTPGRPLDGGFVTGEQGFGHAVLLVPDLDTGHGFYTETMGLHLSDVIEQGGLRIHFYHCDGTAARHHTVALSAAPGMVGMHHIMIEVEQVDDVGRGLDLAKAAGHPIAMDLGRHPNDHMTSFYVRTPSGFDLEYGSGGVTVDAANWETGRYEATSIWGHRPPDGGRLRPAIIRRYEPASAD